MSNPQQPELRRSGTTPVVGPEAVDPDVPTGGTSQDGAPVPPANQQNHHEAKEQDKPDMEAFIARASGDKADSSGRADPSGEDSADGRDSSQRSTHHADPDGGEVHPLADLATQALSHATPLISRAAPVVSTAAGVIGAVAAGLEQLAERMRDD